MTERLHNIMAVRLLPAILIIGMLMAGCRSQRQAAELIPSGARWERMQLPVTLSLSTPQKMSVSGTMNMVRDSSLTISFRMIGMEVAVVAVDSDSVKVLDKFNKRAFTTSLGRLTGNTGLTLGDIQDILTGNYPARIKHLPSGINYTLIREADRTGVVITRQPDRKMSELTVASLLPTPYGEMASRTDMEFYPGGKIVAGAVALNLEKAKWNGDVTPRHVTIPAGYKVMGFDEALKLLVPAR